MAHYIGVIACLFFGLLALTGGIWCESFWFKRRHWERIRGVVVGNEKRTGTDGDTFYCPEIEYSVNGATRRFVSDFGSGSPRLEAEKVEVMIAPDGQSAEWCSETHRWLFSAFLICFGLVWLFVGLNMKPDLEIKPDDGSRPALVPVK